jgi:hypothetical protein
MNSIAPKEGKLAYQGIEHLDGYGLNNIADYWKRPCGGIVKQFRKYSEGKSNLMPQHNNSNMRQ